MALLPSGEYTGLWNPAREATLQGATSGQGGTEPCAHLHHTEEMGWQRGFLRSGPRSWAQSQTVLVLVLVQEQQLLLALKESLHAT